MANGKVAHELQLAERMSQAERALFGIRQIGALSANALPLAKKAQIIAAFGRSRIEYGMAITKHRTEALSRIDTLLAKQVAHCLGSGRGNVLMMRLVGLVPAKTREYVLRRRTHQRMTKIAANPDVKLLAPVVYAAAMQDPLSMARTGWKACTVDKVVSANALRYQQEFRVAAARPGTGLPAHMQPDTVTAVWSAAHDVALRATCWASDDPRLKLMRLQTQEFNQPHPVAQLPGDDAHGVARWMTNLVPGARYPCRGCDGRYPVSRYHLTRCVDAQTALGQHFDAVRHERHLDRADNPLDSSIVGMVPEVVTREQIQGACDRCPLPHHPGMPRQPTRSFHARRKDATPPHRNEALRGLVAAIGAVVRAMRERCCSQDGAADDGAPTLLPAR
jgi:hypothetical protein